MPSSGATDLDLMLREMSPELHPGDYVFCVLERDVQAASVDVLCTFREAEGLTVITSRAAAEARGWKYSFVAGWITLNVHSALESVGLTAAVSQALAQAGISCNVVAAFYHDHLFVPADEAARALIVLRNMAASRAAGS
jgi:hypothetical protein